VILETVGEALEGSASTTQEDVRTEILTHLKLTGQHAMLHGLVNADEVRTPFAQQLGLEEDLGRPLVHTTQRYALSGVQRHLLGFQFCGTCMCVGVCVMHVLCVCVCVVVRDRK
jgi:hypothetical protein